MSTPNPERARYRSRTREWSTKVRWRLLAAMLAMALVPIVAITYLSTSLLGEPDASVGAAQVRETSKTAASLLAQEQAIETRLLMAAADPAMVRLADGLDGPGDRKASARVLGALRGSDGSIVRGACIVRASDGQSFPLVLGKGQGRSSACAGPALWRQAIGATTNTVTSGTPDANGAGTLMLATPLRSVSGRDAGVLSAEVDVAALFVRTRMPGGEAVTSMLVDMGSSEVISASSVAGPDGAAGAGLSAVVPYLDGIVSDDPAAEQELAAMGMVPAVVPLWGIGDGTHAGLLQVWPQIRGQLPADVSMALLTLLAVAIALVLVLVRYFIRPFQELADSSETLRSLYHEAREESLIDGLTGLGNHRAFQEELGQRINAFEQREEPFSLVLMDLDDLKVINDRDGHAAGDEMLVSMAETMRDLARRDDRLYRTGGDEFAMVLSNTSVDDAVGVAERMLHFCKRPPTGARPSPFSCGISGVPTFGRSRDMVYRQADAALYWVKRHGRGAIEAFDADRDRLPEELDDVTGNAVREVVAGKMLRPVFQPIVDLRTGRVLGFEGLIRPDPNGPLPDTTRLFAAAEASGRTVELDLACIEAVVEGAKAIGPDRLLTLNLSPRTLEVRDFDAAWLLSSLVRAGISPSRVIIELTEREEVDDLHRLQQTFNLLQSYGLRLAADDVGAGNAGLRLLSQVQFDIVKIDLSLVHDGVRRLGSRAVLQSLRDLALSQDARIVAEGVETPKQLQVIRDLDIGAGQGFLLGRPDASVAKTFVDVRQLESGVVVPVTAGVPVADAPTPAGAVTLIDEDALSPERRAIFLPPASGWLQNDPAPTN